MNASVVVPTRGEYEVHATSSDDDQSLDTAVAIVAIALGVDRMVRRAAASCRAAFHGREERQATEALSRPGAIRGVAADLVHHRHRWISEARFEETNELFDEMFASEQRRADYHGAMRRKYERAARYPGLSPVEPDPPEPSP